MNQLAEAIQDFNDAANEAEEKEFLIPNDIAICNTRQVLKKLYDLHPFRYSVYPMPDGEMAINLPDRKGSSVLILCDSEGGALCLVNFRGKHRRARYSDRYEHSCLSV